MRTVGKILHYIFFGVLLFSSAIYWYGATMQVRGFQKAIEESERFDAIPWFHSEAPFRLVFLHPVVSYVVLIVAFALIVKEFKVRKIWVRFLINAMAYAGLVALSFNRFLMLGFFSSATV